MSETCSTFALEMPFSNISRNCRTKIAQVVSLVCFSLNLFLSLSSSLLHIPTPPPPPTSPHYVSGLTLHSRELILKSLLQCSKMRTFSADSDDEIVVKPTMSLPAQHQQQQDENADFILLFATFAPHYNKYLNRP